MAYAQSTPVITRRVRGGKQVLLITFTETEAASGSEWSVSGLPVVGTITHYKATLTAGTGTTINPKMGRAAAFVVSTQDHVGTNSTTAAHINDGSDLRYDKLTAGVLYGRSSPNSAVADHSIATEITVVEGHHP